MAIPKRAHNFGTYFITTNTLDRRQVFKYPPNAELFIEKLGHYRANYLLHAFVVMPDHVHILFTPQGVALERAVQLIKGGFSRDLKRKWPRLLNIWQKGYTDHRIRDTEDFVRHKKYIEENPVMAGYVQRPEDYEWSSTFSRLPMDRYLSG
jgi:putative transposase